jgi:DNA polymerase III epsilon subunit family exonuclease
MIEILITVIFLGALIWLVKILLSKLKTKPPSSSTDKFSEHHFVETISTMHAPASLQEMYAKTKKTYLFADLETTGLYANQHEIIEIAAIKYSGGKSAECFTSFVKPEAKIPQKITDLTGITNDMVASAPNIVMALRSFADFIGESSLIFYNASFDKGFIQFAATKAGIVINNKFEDALPLAREAFPKAKNHKLASMSKILKTDISPNHRALDDTKTLMSVYIGCMAILSEKDRLLSVTKLGKMLGGYSAVTTNKALIEQGFQGRERDVEGKWKYFPLESAKQHVQYSEDLTYFQWKESIAEKIDMSSFKKLKAPPKTKVAT